MKAVNEVLKFLSSMPFQERRLSSNVCKNEWLFDQSNYIGVDILCNKDYYYILEAETHYPSVEVCEGPEWLRNEASEIAEFETFSCIHKYSYEGDELEKIYLDNKESDDLMRELPNLSELN